MFGKMDGENGNLVPVHSHLAQSEIDDGRHACEIRLS